MKRLLLLLAIITLCEPAWCQTFSLRINNDDNTIKEIHNNDKITLDSKPDVYEIKTEKSYNKTYKLLINGGSSQAFSGDGEFHALDINKFSTGNFQVAENIANSNVIVTFTLSVGADKDVPPATKPTLIELPPESIADYFKRIYPQSSIRSTNKGLILSGLPSELYSGETYSHIFFDQYGNNLMGAIPPGIPERRYVIHVLYLAPEDNNNLFYAVKETKSGYNPTLNINNPDILKLLAGSSVTISTKNKDQQPKVVYAWKNQEILLSTSTDDIVFDLNKVVADKQAPDNFATTTIGTYTIKMTPSYHVSLDVGLVNSKLENPTYTLVNSGANTTDNVVQKTGGGDRGMITVMATFYTSPVILFEKYLQHKDVPGYKLYSQNYLDDASFIERIYPTLGVGLKDNAFNNLFFGLSWEIVRGAGIFYGWHYGKINTFDTSGNFQFGQTVLNQSQYALRMNTKWLTSTTFGAKVDIKVITGIFGSGSNGK